MCIHKDRRLQSQPGSGSRSVSLPARRADTAPTEGLPRWPAKQLRGGSSAGFNTACSAFAFPGHREVVAR